jgi:hypothetical protein
MINESAAESGRRISEYTSGIKKGPIVTRKISPDAEHFFGLSKYSRLDLFVSDRKAHKADKVEEIANTSLDISYDIFKKLEAANATKRDFEVGGDSLGIELRAEPSFFGYIFGEGSFHVGLHPNPPNGHNQYDMQLNFREIEIDGKPKLAVIVESIHKGVGEEAFLRKKMRKEKLSEVDIEDLKAINEGNSQLADIEKKLGCSMNELAFQTAFAFARGIGADVFMATDDAYMSTKQHYEEKGATKIISSNNWVFQKNGLLPPHKGEYFWINPYPNRMHPEEASLSDSLFFYTNTNTALPDRYRNFPKGVSTLAIQNILSPFENNLRTVLQPNPSQTLVESVHG